MLKIMVLFLVLGASVMLPKLFLSNGAKWNDKESYSNIIKTEDLTFRLETIIDDLDIPWGLDFLPNGDLLCTERDGDFFRIDAEGRKHQITGVPDVKSQGQGGLLDVVIHPDFEQNQFIYLSFSKPNPKNKKKATTAIIRARFESDELFGIENIFEAKPYVTTRHHYGSKFQFDRDGYLFFSVGDRGRRDQHPQNLDNHCGKIHRLHDDGTIPSDNPFVNTAGALGSIYSYGHRNPQGLAIHPSTGQIWEHEHGPRGGDEINRIEAGLNYGWPVISYGINYNGTRFTDKTEQEGMEQPEHYWTPSIAPCGMTFVDGDIYPGWHGDILSGSLSFRYLHRTKMDDNTVIGHEKILENIGRVRAIEIGPDGFIYLAIEGPGKIVKIVPEDE